MTARRRTLPPRDQEASVFSAILMRLCEGTRAHGVALVDQEGETVDYAGYRDPYALRVMAAEWRIVLDIVRDTAKPGFSDAHELCIRSNRASFAIVGLAEGYALVLELPRRGFELSRRALAEAAREIELEAELPVTAVLQRERWSRVEVRTVPGDRRRPEAVWLDGVWQPLVILGRHHVERRVRRQGRGEVGYRARVPTGLEFALVREPLGAWFASDF
jgi:hypothetical protein